MQKTKVSSSSSQQVSHKNKYEFLLDKEKKIVIDSNFDNGNISLIKQISQLNYRLEAVPDTKCRSQQKKSWFYFRVCAPKNTRIRFNIENVSIYENMYQERNWAKPFVRENGVWKQIKDSFLSYRDQVILIFDYTFTTGTSHYFCMTIPQPYDETQAYLEDLKYRVPEQISFQDQILTKSYGELNCHVLKITAKEQKKPIVLITSRVHPGEVGSAYCLMGIIDMLLRFYNPQSKLLLKMFEFIIFPVVNPDGIYEGNYRMDSNNYNLNRVYNEPSPQFHPTVFKIKQYITQLLKTRKILFQFDLHSHSALKSAFIYGNAYDNIISQTQSELFCKVLERNSQIFRFGASQFGEKHMKMKDKGESMSKEGCARVVISKAANAIYSYTVQTSIFPYQTKQAVLPASNKNFKFLESCEYELFAEETIVSRIGTKHELILDNMILGQDILVTILDILEKNPYTRLQEDALENWRKQISQQLFQNQERFKLLDTKAYQKIKTINKLIKEEFGIRYPRLWDFLAVDKDFSCVKWPQKMKWFTISIDDRKKERGRIKTETDDKNKDLYDFINPKNARKNQFHRENSQITHKKQSVSPQNYPVAVPNSIELPDLRAHLQKDSKAFNSNRTTKIYKKSCQSENTYKNQGQFSIPQLDIKELEQIKNLKDKQLISVRQNIVFQSLQQEEVEKPCLNTQTNYNNKEFPKNKFSLINKLSNTKLLKKQTKSAKIIETLINNHKNKTVIKSTCEDVISKRKLNVQDDYNLDALKMEANSFNNKEVLISPVKKEMNRIRYTQIKRRNIIRQDLKLPELKVKGSLFVTNSNEKAITMPDQY